jgi:hypothetical protein
MFMNGLRARYRQKEKNEKKHDVQLQNLHLATSLSLIEGLARQLNCRSIIKWDVRL